jgi:hypothetical protein
MIELQFDVKDIEAALIRLNGSQARLTQIVRDIVPIVARRVRQDVIGYLAETVALAPARGVLVKRAVKAVRNLPGESRFRVASKSLFLGDYDVSPFAVTAAPGVPVKRRRPFHYHLRRQGQRFSSLNTPTGEMGDGSIPFIARSHKGDLRVMYRSAKTEEHDTALLVYAPPIQYHAATPELEDITQELSARIFREELENLLERVVT